MEIATIYVYYTLGKIEILFQFSCTKNLFTNEGTQRIQKELETCYFLS